MSTPVDWSLIAIWVTIFGVPTGVVASWAIARYYWRLPARVLYTVIAGTPHVSGLGSKVPGLELVYNSKVVPSVSVARIVFWNGGRSAIGREHQIRSAPFRYSIVDGKEILAVARSFKGSDANQINAAWDRESIPQSIAVTFENLNPSEGGALQILHTSESAAGIRAEGSFKDALGPIVTSARRRTLPYVIVLPLLAWLGALVFLLPLFNDRSNPYSQAGFAITLLGSIAGALAMPRFLWPWIERHHSPVPLYLQRYIQGDAFQPEAPPHPSPS